MLSVAEDAQRVEVFACRDIAERECLADHRSRRGVERAHVLAELIAQAPFEQARGQPRRAYGFQLVACFQLKMHCETPSRACGNCLAGFATRSRRNGGPDHGWVERKARGLGR